MQLFWCTKRKSHNGEETKLNAHAARVLSSDWRIKDDSKK